MLFTLLALIILWPLLLAGWNLITEIATKILDAILDAIPTKDPDS